MYEDVRAKDVAAILGIAESQVGEYIDVQTLEELRYRPLSGNERDEAFLKAFQRLESDGLRVSGENDSTPWEQGWSEVLERVKVKGVSKEALAPQYFQYSTMRFGGNYVEVSDPRFEYRLYNILKELIFRRYLSDVDKIVELGCGTGSNLYMLGQIFPDKELIGSDWARASQQLLEVIANESGLNLRGEWFNMLNGEGQENLTLGSKSACLTMHSMEQLGDSWQSVLDFIVKGNPDVCIHIEPIDAFYDPNALFDHVALQYHRKRNYLNGFHGGLKELEKAGEIEVLEERRLGFGSHFHEAYGLVVWRNRS
ncbi:MAG: class I SAM-dependent methyltransferase [Myxococcota bacterium]|nr:class I SAM-dependent methyltransferase [Myxococcota bacterium]